MNLIIFMMNILVVNVIFNILFFLRVQNVESPNDSTEGLGCIPVK